MTFFEVVVLALVQGLTEFLPVSSSGHLLVARLLFGISDTKGTAFDAFLHLGTVGAVFVYYWSVWRGIATSVWRRDREGLDKRELLGKIILATIPGAVIGYFFQEQVDAWLRGPRVLVGSFLFTAFILWWFDRRSTNEKDVVTLGEGQPKHRAAQQGVPRLTKRRATWGDAFIIGCSQVLALVPAVSRSGVTIAAGRARGLTRPQAVTFSFLMSAPIIAGASLAGLKALVEDAAVSGQLLVVGTAVSFISGLAAIYLMMRLVERVSFMPFVIYLVGLSVVVWLTT